MPLNIIFTESQLVYIYKIHKYCRIFQLLNIRSSEFYTYIHTIIILLIILATVLITILNFTITLFKTNPILNIIIIICNTFLVGFELLLSIQKKTEYYRGKSLHFNSLANDIEEDLILRHSNSLEYHRIICRFKELIMRDDYDIPNIIINKLKKKIKFENIEFEDILMLEPSNFNT